MAMTKEQALALASARARLQAQPQQEQQSQSWGNVASQAIGNIPSSAANMASGLGQAIMHPIDTYKGMADLVGGELSKILPDWASKLDNPKDVARAQKTASAVNDFYANRYGSMEGFKQSLAQDPVGVVSDLSAALGIGGALAPGKVGAALKSASMATNPINIAGKGVKLAGKAIGTTAKTITGMITGAGSDAMAQAAKAGYTGNKTFLANMRGNVPIDDVLATAKQNLQMMRSAKNLEYKNNMAAVASDKTVLDFKGIDKAINNAKSMVTFKGQVKSPVAGKYIQKISEAVDDWKNLNPAEYHTPEGLDALKQKIWSIMEKIPDKQKTAELAAQGVYNSVKNEIAAQAPIYSKTMEQYSNASDQINEIQRALSLGKKASPDTAIRKLQSLMRNNVNTNYGNRLKMAKTLEQGRQEILPALAGQALNSWEPRGLSRLGAFGILGAGALLDPKYLAMLPLESPRLMGELAYHGGRGAGISANVLNKFPVTEQQALMSTLLAAKGGSLLGVQ